LVPSIAVLGHRRLALESFVVGCCLLVVGSELVADSNRFRSYPQIQPEVELVVWEVAAEGRFEIESCLVRKPAPGEDMEPSLVCTSSRLPQPSSAVLAPQWLVDWVTMAI